VEGFPSYTIARCKLAISWLFCKLCTRVFRHVRVEPNVHGLAYVGGDVVVEAVALAVLPVLRAVGLERELTPAVFTHEREDAHVQVGVCRFWVAKRDGVHGRVAELNEDGGVHVRYSVTICLNSSMFRAIAYIYPCFTQ
jgi:hypothetical protein